MHFSCRHQAEGSYQLHAQVALLTLTTEFQSHSSGSDATKNRTPVLDPTDSDFTERVSTN
jgi:hypothetical protein